MSDKTTIYVQCSYPIYDNNGSPMSSGKPYTVKRTSLIEQYIAERLVAEDVVETPEVFADESVNDPALSTNTNKTNRKRIAADDPQENSNG